MKLLYYSPNMEALAREIAAGSDKITLGELSWKFHPDDSPKFNFLDKSKIEGADVFFLSGIEHRAVVFEHLSVMYAIPAFDPARFTVILPYFFSGQEDRLEADKEGAEEGKIATAKTFARMLSAIPLSAYGPTRIFIYDIHALQERFFFGDFVKPKHRSALPMLLERWRQTIPDLTIVLPDGGAAKRYAAMLEGIPLVICSKGERDAFGEPEIRIESGDPEGRNNMIVDDVGQRGGTTYQCAKVLRQRNPKSVRACNIHAVFPNNAHERFFDGMVEKFEITNSCPTRATELDGDGPFKVVSLAPLLAQEILKPVPVLV